MVNKNKIIERFNEVFGSDIKNLNKIGDFHKQLEKEKHDLELSLTLASSEFPSKVKAAIDNAESVKSNIIQLIEDSDELETLIKEALEKNDKAVEIKRIVDQVEELEKAHSYLHLLKSIEDISTELEGFMASSDNDEATINLFTKLVEINNQLRSSNCSNLLNYVQETVHYWYNYLKDKYSKEYTDILKTLRWPFCGTNLSVLTAPSSESVEKFKVLTKYLLQLKLPQENEKTEVKSALLTNFPPISLPITLLTRPLRQRFVYHFTGNKQTNRHDKPEWFFTQILTWIKDHELWIEKNVQPVVDSLQLYLNAKIEFIRALVQLAVEKLDSELQIIQYDDSLFAHLIDEALGFERELRDTYFYPSNEPVTVFILTQANVFVKWINMEKKYATEKMDAILGEPTAWESVNMSEQNEMKVTECADAFLTLLSTISDRYSHLPQPGHRLQFLELQLELIDDWRIRLLQLLRQDCEDPLNSLIPRILNSLNYVSNVLMDWGVTVNFLQLHYFKKQCQAIEEATEQGINEVEDLTEESGTVFDEAVALLKRLENELLDEIINSVALEIKAKSRPYRTDKWFAMQSEKEVASLSLTQSASSMFEELTSRLYALNNVLSSPLFDIVWRNIANQLDNYLYEGVVLENQFNAGGAAQFKYDMYRNLFPLFGLYTQKPESYFPLIRESCILLNMLLGSVILLIDVLENSKDTDDEIAKEVLADVGVFNLTPKSALAVLKSRTDLTI